MTASPFSAPEPVADVEPATDPNADPGTVDLTHLALVIADLMATQLRIAELGEFVAEKRAIIEGALGDSEVGRDLIEFILYCD